MATTINNKVVVVDDNQHTTTRMGLIPPMKTIQKDNTSTQPQLQMCVDCEEWCEHLTENNHCQQCVKYP